MEPVFEKVDENNIKKVETQQVVETVYNVDEVKAKAAKRIDAITKEAEKVLEIDTGPMDAWFLECLTAYRSEDSAVLLGIVDDALKNAGETPDVLVRNAAQAFLDSQRKRMDEGLFVKVDAGIFALAQ